MTISQTLNTILSGGHPLPKSTIRGMARNAMRTGVPVERAYNAMRRDYNVPDSMWGTFASAYRDERKLSTEGK